MSANPTVDQLHLLAALALSGPASNAELARAIGKTPTYVAHLLLPLQPEGIVFISSSAPVTWELTNYGLEWLAKNYPAVVEPRAKPKEKYILWCPTSSKPPQVTYSSLGKAKEVQKIMADRHHGQVFYICAVGSGLQVQVQKVTKYVEV